MPEAIFTITMANSLAEKVAKKGGKNLTKQDWEQIAEELNAENVGARLEWTQVKEKAKKLKAKAKAEIEGESHR